MIRKAFIDYLAEFDQAFQEHTAGMLNISLDDYKYFRLVGVPHDLWNQVTRLAEESKIKNAIGKPLPFSTKEGLLKTFKSFNN
jgi:hypothetical protein